MSLIVARNEGSRESEVRSSLAEEEHCCLQGWSMCSSQRADMLVRREETVHINLTEGWRVDVHPSSFADLAGFAEVFYGEGINSGCLYRNQNETR